MNGVVPVFPNFDTPAVLGRDLAKFPMLIDAWYHQPKILTSHKPPVVFVPPDFLSISAVQLEILNRFAEDFANEIAAQIDRKSIAACWADDAPTQDADLDHYLMNVRDRMTLFSHMYD